MNKSGDLLVVVMTIAVFPTKEVLPCQQLVEEIY
jgi:hypothetical protein